MKKQILQKSKLSLLFLLTFFTFSGFAQDFNNGMRGGGNATNDGGNAICHDKWGNIYMAGASIYVIGFPGTNAVSFKANPNDKSDFYLVKYDAEGVLQWGTKGYGPYNDGINSLTCDDSGNVYIAGYFNQQGGNGDTITLGNLKGKNITLTSKDGGADILLAKYNPKGVIQWAKTYGNDNDETALKISYKSGNLIVAGLFDTSCSFGRGVIRGGPQNVFIGRFDLTGNPIWLNGIGSRAAFVGDVAFDPNDDIYMTGRYLDTSFASGIKLTPYDTTSTFDVFVSKYNFGSGKLSWAKQYTGAGNDYGFGIAADKNFNIYTVGAFFQKTNFNGISLKPSGNIDMYLAKMDSSGKQIAVKGFGDASKTQYANRIAIDDSNNLYVSGNYGGTIKFNSSYTFTSTEATASPNYPFDIFLAKFDTSLSVITASQANSSVTGRYGGDAILDLSLYHYSVAGTGSFNDDGFTTKGNIDFGSTTLTSTGAGDIFGAMYGDCSSVPTVSVKIKGNTNLCPGDSAILVASVSPKKGVTAFNWYNGSTQILATDSQSQFTVKSGGNYQLKIVTENGCVVASGLNTFILSAGPNVSVTRSPNNNVCSGDSISFAGATSIGATYQWYRNGFKIAGATNYNYVAKNDGGYALKVSTGTGCAGISPEDTVAFFSLPAKPSISGNLGLCTGDSSMVTIKSFAKKSLFNWYKNGILQSNNSKSFYVNDAASFKISEVDSNKCVSPTKDTFSTISSKPSFSTSITGLSPYCEGDSVKMIASFPTSNFGYTYAWFKDATQLSGLKGTSIFIKKSGKYTLEVNNKGCREMGTVSNVTFKTKPSKPSILKSGTDLTSNITASKDYTWEVNGSTISGVNSKTITPTQNGIYKVTLNDTNGCKTTSDTFGVTFVSIESFSANVTNVLIYPNPVIGNDLNINFNTNTIEPFLVILKDINGKIVLQSNAKSNLGQNKLSLHLENLNLPSGTYVLDIVGKTLFVKGKIQK